MSQFISSGLLAASMLLGQPGEPGKIVPSGPVVQQAQPARGPIIGWMKRDDRPVLNRIQGWFKRDQPDTSSKYVQPNVIKKETEAPPIITPPTSNDFPRKLPNPTSQTPAKKEVIVVKEATKTVQQAAATQPDKAKSPILPQLANKMGRDDKFEWITGQLEIEHGAYVIYYATPETIDKYQGRMVLTAQPADMKDLRKGDLISIRGQLVQRPAGQATITTYRVTHASLIERPKGL